MFRSILRRSRTFGPYQMGRILAVAALLCVAGCTSTDFRGENFKADPLFEVGSRARAGDRDTPPVAVSNKSMQIERNLGVGR